MSYPILLLIILVEGFVTISAEILTIRQLLPVVGNSVIVTSLIIGIFLLFLAYGYRRGGQYQKNFNTILKRNFCWSALWFGVGLSYVFIFMFFEFFKRYFPDYELWALTAYLLVVTAPLVYVLGQTVPITMNIIRQAKTTGATGGKILHLSTIGSFLGAVITSLILMNYLGVAWTVMINTLLLVLLTLVLSTHLKDTIRMLFLLIVLLVVYRINVVVEKKVYAATNTYANYEVITNNNAKYLLSNESPSSYLNDKKEAFPYIEFIKRLLFEDLGMRNKDILVLGAGGFTLSAQSTYGNRFLYVDIDKEVKEVVQKYFLNPIQGAFVAEDARDFLNKNDKKFDAIVSDVYSSFRAIPAHLLTREYFMQVNQALNDKGIAIFNIIARPALDDAYSARIDNTIRSVFSRCMVMPTKFSSSGANIIYVCQREANLPHLKEIYTDDLNSATLDFFKEIGGRPSGVRP